MIETAAKRRRPRPPVQGCAAVDRRSGIRDCTGCGYYRPLSADLLLGMACHYSLDTGQLREVPPAVCFRRALHRARRPGPGRPRKQREEVSDMTPKTAQDPPAAAGAQSASPAPVMRAKTPTGQGAPDAGETPPAPIARRQTARRDTGAAPAPTPDKEAASAKLPVSTKAPAKASAKAPAEAPAPAPLAPAKTPAKPLVPAAGDVPGKTDGPAAGETPAEESAKPPAPASREIPAGGIFTESPAASRAGQGREETAGENPNAARRTALCPAAFASPGSSAPASQNSAPQGPGSTAPASGERTSPDPAPQGTASQTPAGKGPAEKLEQLLERAAPAAVEALLRTVQDERASCAQRLDAAKILLERAAPRAGGGEGVLRVVLEDGAAELIE